MKKLLAIMLVLSLIVSMAACGGTTTPESSTEAPASEAPVESSEEPASEAPAESSEEPAPAVEEPAAIIPAVEGEIRLGQAYYAAHGTKAFAVATVLLNGDKIAMAYIDEYQVMAKDSVTGVPNSDGGFAENLNDATTALASKRTNDEYYSKNMTEKAQATQALSANWEIVQNYTVGKTAAELEGEFATATAEQAIDIVAGSTLADTAGYVKAIAAAAQNAQTVAPVKYEGDVTALKLGKVDFAAHGDKAFAIVVAVVEGDKVVLSHIDELQFLDGATAVGVPNSDTDFGTSFKEGLVLASKRVNNEMYSKNMAEKANATTKIADGYNLIQNYANGKTVAELEGVATGDATAALDAVAGSTLADTAGYVGAIVAAAKAAA